LHRIIAVLLLLATVSIHCEAKDKSPYSKEFTTCIEKSGGVTVSMRDCSAAEYKKQDDRLNRNYKKLKESLSEAQKQQLLEAQRIWLKFRDTNCDLYAKIYEGTMALIVIDDCYLTAVTERATELENIIDYLRL
jgi:uncharacterized protein YecT (DUF1311 family)